MKSKMNFGTWARNMLFAGGCLATAAACGDTAFAAGEWDVSFAEEGATLKLTHRPSGIEMSGELAFLGPEKATDAAADPKADWKVGDPRDGVPRRLAVIDCNNDAQGYIAFQPNGARLEMLVYHRTALAYSGHLSYAGEIHGRTDAFAANTSPLPDDRVLQLSSGAADSALFNTLFSPSRDEAFQVLAPGGAVLESGAPGTWSFSVYADISDPDAARIRLNVERDYYRSRWVPYYAPIDRTRCPRAPTGWMSWNIYFDQAGSKENLAEARLGAKYLKPFGL